MTYKNTIRKPFLTKTASLFLAVILFIGPFGDIPFAHASLVVGDPARTTQNAVQPVSLWSSYDNASGAFDYQYEIALPPGVNGHTPTVSLLYNSHEENVVGVYGAAWKDSIPYISLSSRKGVNTIYDDPVFVSSLDGELIADGSDYRPEVDFGNFRVYSHPNQSTWETTDKDGTTHIFSSHMADPDDPNRIYRWYLASSTDSNGNEISYTYINSDGQLYPSTISYGPYTVVFTVASSSKRGISYRSGFRVYTGDHISKIEVKKSGDTFATYDLSYSDGRLNSITPTTDVAKPAVVFEYGAGTGDWVYQSALNHSANVDHNDGITQQYFDFNGDGLVDRVNGFESSYGSNALGVIFGNGSGWVGATSTFPGLPSPIYLSSDDPDGHNARVADFNGDGLADIAYQYTTSQMRVYLNAGENTFEYESSLNHSANVDSSNGITQQYFDFNGDGLADKVNAFQSDSGSSALSVSLNTGTGWETASSSFLSGLPSTVYFSSDTVDGHNARVADFNGDGLADIAYQYTTSQMWVYLNSGGGGFEHETSLDHSSYVDHNNGITQQYFDFNGDGLADKVNGFQSTYGSSALSVSLNTGTGWGATISSFPGLPSPIYLSSDVSDGLNARIADFNGDGLADIAYQYTSSNMRVYLNPGPDFRLATITDPVSDTATVIEYQPLWQSSTDNTVPISLQVVKSVTKTSSVTETTDEYVYEGAYYYLDRNDIYDHRFVGFGKVTKTTDLGKEITYYHQGNEAATSSEEEIDGEALFGVAYRTEKTDLSDNLYQLNRYNYATSSLSSSSTFVKLESDLQLDYDGDSDKKASANSYIYSGDHGSMLTKTEWGEVSGSTDGTFTDTGTDDRETTYEYATSSDLVLPSKITVEDDSSTKVQESRYYYDNQSLGSVTTGNLTKQQDWVIGSTYVDTELTYDSYGNILTKTDPNSNVTLFAYDTYNLFVASTTDAEGHNTQYEYDYRTGQVGTTTNANGEVFVTIYDGFGRPTAKYMPDPQTGSQVQIAAYTYTDTAGAISVQQTDYLDGSTSHSKYTYYDGFGQVIQERVEAEGSTQYAVRDYIYGDNGLLKAESLPYFSTGTTSTNATTDGDLMTSYVYDALARITAVGTVVGTTSTSYDQWQETVTDAASNDKIFEYDAYGRLTLVTEEEGVSSYDTVYDWNARGDLIKITDAAGNVRNLTYDGLSRRTSLEDLHDTSDTDYGTWLFSYDDAGNVSSTTDPKGQVVNYTYDGVNRVLTEDYLGTGYTDVTYVYDNCTNGASQLCFVANESATTTYTYTPNGLIDTETKTIAGTEYATEYEYDRLGNQTLLTYPDDSEVRYTYNKANKLEKVEQRESGGSFADVVNNFEYGPHDLITQQVHSNGATTTKTYDASELYRLSSIVTTATSTAGSGGPGEEMVEIMLLLDSPDFELLSSGSISSDTSPHDNLDLGESQVADENPEIVWGVSETGNSDGLNIVQEKSTTSTTTVPVVFATTSTSSGNVIDVVSQQTKESKSTAAGQINKIDKRATYVSDSKADKADFKELGGKLALSKVNGLEVEVAKNRPEVSFKKWNEKVDFSISYNDISIQEADFSAGNLIRWKNQDQSKEVHVYPLSSDEQMENGGLEIEVVLAEKPDSNKFRFSLSGYENLDFFYQPELTEEEIGEGKERPENIVGSYAVYHKELSGHVLGGVNYGAGKVFHIYRPKIADSSGDEVWGALSIVDGELIVTVPQEFLDTAEYPVFVDPTFGDTSIGGSLSVHSGKDYGGIKGTPGQSGTVSSIKVYTRKQKSGSTVIGTAIYSDSSGSPNSRLAVDTGNQTITTTPAWISSNINLSVTGSTPYWIMYWPQIPSVDYYDSVSNAYKYETGGSFEGWPSSFTATQVSSIRLTMYAEYTLNNQAPTSPTELKTEGSANPTAVSDSAPEFTAVYNDPDSGDQAVNYQIQVDDDSGFGSTIWDSGKTALATTSQGSTTPSISYGGSTLASSTLYYWRIKFWDDEDEEGIWSTSTATFVLATGTDPYALYEVVQRVNYVYDSVGNITQIADSSGVVSSATTTYGYDDLYRLTSASTTLATTTPYSRTYTYSPIGNILSKSDQGSYTYAETGYANPHAATAINGVTYTYDKNGNLASTSASTTNTWNYRNQLVESDEGTATTSYGYDHNGSRVFKITSEGTTYYPFANYEITDTGTTTKHIYAGDMLVATVEGSGAGALTYHNHLDHLNSTRVVTDGIGYTAQVLDYYPFGATRIDAQYGNQNQTKRFTGHEYDDETDLSYMGARYYAGDTGRFTSQDPLHIRLDKPNLLTNPQKLNSYSYVENNPLIKFDPNGESSAMFWGNMQRVDNLSGGYISRETRSYQQAGQTAVNAATSPQAQAVYTVAGLAALTLAAPELGVPISTQMARSAAVTGISNAAFSGYVDKQDGSFDGGPLESGSSYLFGMGTAGSAAIKKSGPLVVGPAAAAAESYLFDGKVSGSQVGASGAGGTAGFLFETALTTSPVGNKAGFAGQVIQGTFELSVTIGAYKSLERDDGDDN